ncbi:putative C2H2-type domain-containing protein [Seiridium cardinale]|uniref:C2H2-type domain-containing protein n=1 Tax=Seiridium cardinale TaxID=138064 RepID=A0ABR2XZA8_9PEZI
MVSRQFKGDPSTGQPVAMALPSGRSNQTGHDEPHGADTNHAYPISQYLESDGDLIVARLNGFTVKPRDNYSRARRRRPSRHLPDARTRPTGSGAPCSPSAATTTSNGAFALTVGTIARAEVCLEQNELLQGSVHGSIASKFQDSGYGSDIAAGPGSAPIPDLQSPRDDTARRESQLPLVSHSASWVPGKSRDSGLLLPCEFSGHNQCPHKFHYQEPVPYIEHVLATHLSRHTPQKLGCWFCDKTWDVLSDALGPHDHHPLCERGCQYHGPGNKPLSEIFRSRMDHISDHVRADSAILHSMNPDKFLADESLLRLPVKPRPIGHLGSHLASSGSVSKSSRTEGPVSPTATRYPASRGNAESLVRPEDARGLGLPAAAKSQLITALHNGLRLFLFRGINTTTPQRTSHQDAQDTPNQGSGHKRGSASVPGKPPTKRSRRNVGKPSSDKGGDGNGDDGDDDPPRERRLDTDRTDLITAPLRLACPFVQHDPERNHQKECKAGWPSVRRLKEHLRRRHLPQLRCNCCQRRFFTEKAQEKHKTNCVQVAPVDDSIQAKLDQLHHNNRFQGKAETEKWAEVYSILFPEVRRDLYPSSFCESTIAQTAKITPAGISGTVSGQSPKVDSDQIARNCHALCLNTFVDRQIPKVLGNDIDQLGLKQGTGFVVNEDKTLSFTEQGRMRVTQVLSQSIKSTVEDFLRSLLPANDSEDDEDQRETRVACKFLTDKGNAYGIASRIVHPDFELRDVILPTMCEEDSNGPELNIPGDDKTFVDSGYGSATGSKPSWTRGLSTQAPVANTTVDPARLSMKWPGFNDPMCHGNEPYNNMDDETL